MANTWQGAFPHENLTLDGYERRGASHSAPSLPTEEAFFNQPD